MLIEALKAFLIGLVEGLTEWLPISSTGHMILVDEFVKLDVSSTFLELFLVVIQIGAIMPSSFSISRSSIRFRVRKRLRSERIPGGCGEWLSSVASRPPSLACSSMTG